MHFCRDCSYEPLEAVLQLPMSIPFEDELEHEFDGPDGTDDTASAQDGQDEASADPIAPPAAQPDIVLPGVPRWVSPEDRLLTWKNLPDTIGKHFTELEVKIEESTPEAYRHAFNCATAKGLRNVVYLFRAERKVSRLQEASDILYIGQTKYSLSSRYRNLADKLGGLQRNKRAVKLRTNSLFGMQVQRVRPNTP